MAGLNQSMIECEGVTIAALVETESVYEHPIYYPANMLIYVEKGNLRLNTGGNDYNIGQGEFGFVRKYTHGKYYKTVEDVENGFREYLFILDDTFIKEVIHNFTLPEDFMPCTVPMVKLKSTTFLMGLMNSISTYVTGQAKIDRNLIRIKTMEAIYAISESFPEVLHVLSEFSEPARADLVQFVEHNYTQNISLDRLAQLSGRSLSTFNREFRKEFKVSPHKWIKQKRLELAKKLLTSTSKKASDIYLDVGFEDLAHFSRSFKSYFGQNPSEIKAAIA